MEQKDKQFSKLKIDTIKKKDLKTIFETLMIPTLNRTIADLNTISRIIMNITPMKDMKDLSATYRICKEMHISKFKQKDFIYQKKEDAEALYIVLNGKVGLYRKSGDDFEADEVIFMVPGCCFGQIYNWKYKLLPLALQDTLIAILQAKDLCKIPMEMAIQKEIIVKELRIAGIFPKLKNNNISNSDIHEASQLCSINRIPHGTYLIQQGQIPKGLFYILKGMVKKNSNKPLQVCRYCRGDFFPQLELTQSINYSLITECPSEIITIPKKALKKLNYPIKKNSESNLKDQSYYLAEIEKQKQWKKYKQNLLAQLFKDIQNKKSNNR